MYVFYDRTIVHLFKFIIINLINLDMRRYVVFNIIGFTVCASLLTLYLHTGHIIIPIIPDQKPLTLTLDPTLDVTLTPILVS